MSAGDLIAAELGPTADLDRLLNHGYLPRIYEADRPHRMLDAYAATYLKEEVAAEGLVRDLPAFSEFLSIAALRDTELVNFSTIARTQREREQVALLLGPMSILSFDEAAAGAAADVRRLEKSGTAIGMADYLIVGICLSRQAELWTRNHAHFARIPGLRVSSYSG